MSTTTSTTAAEGPPTGTFQVPRDPGLLLLERRHRLSNNVPEERRGMSEEIGKLLDQARTPGATQDPAFRTQVAYLLQDWPKFSGSQVTIILSPALQAELPPLARAYPGLESTRMQALVAGTENLRDRELISDIRAAAAEVAGLGGGSRQLGILVSEMAKILEHRVVTASATAAAHAAREVTPVSTASVESPAADSIPPRIAPSAEGRPDSKPLAQTIARDEKPVPDAQPSPPAGAAVQTAAVAGPASGIQVSRPAQTNAAVRASGVLASRVSGLRQRMNEDKVKSATETVLRAGTAAVDALEAFRTGPGREFSNKLDAAARHEPGGVADVIAKMTPDGTYSGLRREFDEKLRTDPSFAAAHDDVVKFADRYFRKRHQAQETARNVDIDYSAVDAQAQRADAEIGEAASKIPAREAGKSVLADLGNRAVELFNAAVQGLKALLGREVGPEARPRPSPSPG